MVRLFLILAVLALSFTARAAEPGCTLVVSYPQGKILRKEGDCDTRRAPASTFKIPLALMGFDSAILTDAHAPSWFYEKGFTVNKPDDLEPADPTRWEKDSVVWYSQKLTRLMGMAHFQAYVDRFDYGNRDLSGGLEKAWLFTSLTISPTEQIAFIRGMFDRTLGVRDHAYAMTMVIVPIFMSHTGWQVHGKTGSGTLPDGKTAQGWFVGWAEKEGQRVIFAKLIFADADPKKPAGPQARESFLDAF